MYEGCRRYGEGNVIIKGKGGMGFLTVFSFIFGLFMGEVVVALAEGEQVKWKIPA